MSSSVSWLKGEGDFPAEVEERDLGDHMRADEFADLRALAGVARQIQKSLVRKPFRHPRIAVSVDEALRRAVELEEWVEDAVCIVGAEFYVRNKPKKSV